MAAPDVVIAELPPPPSVVFVPGVEDAEFLLHQEGIGLVQLLHPGMGFLSGVDVGVPPFGQLPVVLPGLLGRRVPAEAQQLTGKTQPREVAEALLGYGVKIVVLKMGEQGCYVLSHKGEEYSLPVYPVEVVDGTGSGDAFVAGFLRGYLESWPLEKCAKFGNAAGALCVTGIGATAGTRSFDDTLMWLREREPGYW